ncbi:MAG: hypothetical protein A3K66_05890 [Euryarchaeota archaeon RBG_16_67_27]|nr:MAG: hypothetical protein A3K66_05890 [Euryarchaeota archaeon RBG_16_67_27]
MGRIVAQAGRTVTVEVGELQKILGVFNDRSGAKASAVVTRSGVPVAWVLPDGSHADNLGTMAATLLGALDVIFSGFGREAPAEVAVQSSSGAIVARNVTDKAFLFAVADRITPEFERELAKTVGQARQYLGADVD